MITPAPGSFGVRISTNQTKPSWIADNPRLLIRETNSSPGRALDDAFFRVDPS